MEDLDGLGANSKHTNNSKRRIVTTVEQPQLAPVVASWLWEAFARARGRSLEEMMERVQASVTAPLIPRTYILLLNEEPIGTRLWPFRI
jgi:hypothetical protein